MPSPTIVWFRRDLRLADNPALSAALELEGPLILLYILEEAADGERAMGGAQAWWLDKSLQALAKSIASRGGTLTLRRGPPESILPQVTRETGARTVVWNRRYGATEREADANLKARLKDDGIAVETFNGNLLTEPWTVKTGSGRYYKVFTPYWKTVRANFTAPAPRPAPERLNTVEPSGDDLGAWGLHPIDPDWSIGFEPVWTPGEDGALDRLEAFLSSGLSAYAEHRNRPDIDTGTSRLSPHLAHGEIAPATIWRTVRQAMQDGRRNIDEESAWVFLSEVVWREFSYVLLFHNPDLATQNYNPGFDAMPWRDSDDDYERWCHGQTGYPIVDAGMRQLWQTGWMHNRVRMIVASFLTKHLLLPWQKGEAWFWDTLVDADPASNAASWQWTAGSGADAAPYFRVFNPITQGEKFDETGDYVRTYCPELKNLPRKVLYAPWTADKATLAAAGVELGKTYPFPIVEHKHGRERALAAYDDVKARKTT
ncbi:MAG: deoxyribodipyrimidine photo-lyase [Pseudomonadota bacterium]